MSWISTGDNYQAVSSPLAAIADIQSGLYRSFWQLDCLPPRVLELCRLRLAQLHGSDAALAISEVELEANERDQLSNWASAESFSDAERACLAFAEVHAMDATAITDEQAEAVKAHFGEVGLVALIQALGVFDGMIRLGLVWGLDNMEVAEHGS